ncbi:MAG: hypothetical protein AB7T63_10290 [Planctomycetota bacterium]
MKDAPAVVALLDRTEPVLQTYDGLQGKVIKWTLAHGNTNHDPSVLCWLVHADGEPSATLQTGGQYQPSSMARWLGDELVAYEKAHPRTRVPFVRAVVKGTAESPQLEGFDTGRADGPVAIYVGRDRHEDDDKAGKTQTKRSRSFEKAVLGSKRAADEAQGWALLRLDLADPLHAAWAKAHGVEAAPALLLYPVGAATPIALDYRATAAQLARHFERDRRVEAPVEPEPAK